MWSESEHNNKNREVLGEFLHANAKRGNWEAVVKKYAEFPDEAQRLKLTRTGDTALHLAVIDNQEETVERLVKLIINSKPTSSDYYNRNKLLAITNERENNPLHLAAVMGNVRMCHVIASANQELVDMRNKVDETPLFLAAVYGHRNAFYCLYYFCRSDHSRIATNCRVKTDGDTVLHCALRNDHFDLAFQLIHMNNDAMSWVNERGFTPLHVLATKPTSFISGSHIRGWKKIVYYCTFVDKLKPRSIETLHDKEWKKCRLKLAETANFHGPDNYETCIDFFSRLTYIFVKVSCLKYLLKKKKNDEAKKDKDLEKDDIDDERKNFDLKTDESVTIEPGITNNINVPKNYSTCIDIFQIIFSAIMIILGFGFGEIKKIRKKKEKHTWSIQVMEKLLEFTPPDKYGHDGKIPMDSKFESDKEDGITHPYSLVDDEVQFSNAIDTKPIDEKPKLDVLATETQTPMLLAAKNGVIEIVTGMFKCFPLAIRESRKDKKNVVLLAAEYRQPDVYRFLLNQKYHIESLFRAVDNDGNSALHLAANAIDPKLWRITGVALQMQWEVKWYKYVKESVPLHFFAHYNNEGKTASRIFYESHMNLVKAAKDWLYSTSESCSLVATLIATVAFATATAIPGGYNDDGAAILEKEGTFFMFAISSVIALCLSSTSVIMFLAILTSRFNTKNDFGSTLPWKLLIGLSSLYFSIIAMLISFCTGNYFLILHRLNSAVTLLYTLTFLPVALIFGIVQLPLYFDLLQALLKIVPKRSSNVLCN